MSASDPCLGFGLRLRTLARSWEPPKRIIAGAQDHDFDCRDVRSWHFVHAVAPGVLDVSQRPARAGGTVATVFHFFAGRFSAEIPAMMTPKYDTDKDILVVDIDWSSTGIWIRESNGRHANLAYDSLDLPPWLVARFEYWTWWYNRWEFWSPGGDDRKPDKILFGAYGFSLAVDLKRVVGDRFHVEYRKKEIVVPNPENVEEVQGHTWQGSEPEDRGWMEYFPIPRPQEG